MGAVGVDDVEAEGRVERQGAVVRGPDGEQHRVTEPVGGGDDVAQHGRGDAATPVLAADHEVDDTRLGVLSTARNWNTVTKLLQLLGD